MSKSRAKKKQRRRARAGGSPQRAVPRASPGPEAPGHRGRPQREARRADARITDPARKPSRLEIRDGVPRPDGIWAPFPLTEIGMGAGLVLFLIGFAGAPVLLLTGVAVLVVVVAELCLREHFAGFRSHSIMLAMLPVCTVHVAVVVLADVAWRGPLALAGDLAIAGALAWWLQQRFRVVHGRARRRAT